jgi:hypothetical protein
MHEYKVSYWVALCSAADAATTEQRRHTIRRRHRVDA